MAAKFRSFYGLGVIMRNPVIARQTVSSACDARLCYPSRVCRGASSLAGDTEPSGRPNNGRGGIVVGAGIAAAATLLGGGIVWLKNKPTLIASGIPVSNLIGEYQEGLPTYSRADVARHKTNEDRIWVTYKQGVYDITDFIAKHPAGSGTISLAAGSDLGPFFDLYAGHKESKHVKAILSKLRIGNIIEPREEIARDKDDPFRNDPTRSPLLIANVQKPFNAEPSPLLLVDKFDTPNDIFYVRNHLPVPNVDVKSFRLAVGIEGKTRGSFSLNALKHKFPKTVVSAAIQCAGNRRSEFNAYKQVKGNNWNFSAIGNANWGGVTLRQLFEYCGVDVFQEEYKHAQFEGLDKGIDGAAYGASIPIEIARQRLDDIVIAYEMNGESLSPDHGFPLRVIIPGVVGARQVKWLTKIALSTEESPSHWQQLDYKGFSPSAELNQLDYSQSVAISDLPVTSAVCVPANGAKIDADEEFILAKGYAWSGGGRGIIRVDVSADGGKTWIAADLMSNEQNLYKSWAWVLWEAAIPVRLLDRHFEVVCKATDVGYNVQPENVNGVWNARGVLNNSWHRVKVTRES